MPGDLRSYGGGNGLPRPVQQSPEVSRIVEEDEEAEKTLVFERFRHGRTLTPLLTETLKREFDSTERLLTLLLVQRRDF